MTGVEKEETESRFEAMNAPEDIKKTFGRRKDWLDTLTVYGMAIELSRMMKHIILTNLEDITKTSFWETWLNEEVDDNGKNIGRII